MIPTIVLGAKYAIVLVKAWQTERAAHQLKECLAEDGLVLTLQNGLGNYETLIQSLGLARVSLGTTTAGATLLGPGLVKEAGAGIISIEQNQALGPLEAALRSAKFKVEIVKDARSLIWGKLVDQCSDQPIDGIVAGHKW